MASTTVPQGSPLNIDSAQGPYFSFLSSTAAYANDGSFVVVWRNSQQSSATQYAPLWAQRFSANGSPLGAPIQVSGTDAPVSAPAIAVDGHNNFVVAWRKGDPANVTAGSPVARQFAADGTPLGDEFCLDVSCGSNRTGVVSLAAMDNGDFVALWTASSGSSSSSTTGVYLRRFNADATPKDAAPILPFGETKASTSHVYHYIQQPTLSINKETGDFVVSALKGDGYSGVSYLAERQSIELQRYAADGTPMGSETSAAQCSYLGNGADSLFGCALYSPFVAMDDSGNVALVYERRVNRLDSIFAQRYAPDGTAVGTKMRLTPTPIYGGLGELQAASGNGSGGIVAVWRSVDAQSGKQQISGRKFSADGSMDSKPFAIPFQSANVLSSLISSAIINSDNQIVVLWGESDGSTSNLYGQRLMSQ
jgi:hypothetical protein